MGKTFHPKKCRVFYIYSFLLCFCGVRDTLKLCNSLCRPTTRITQTTTRFIQAITSSPPRNTNPLARCRQIQSDPSLAAEVLLRERLVFPAEGN